jgi:nucleoside-diphosphate-sugar epimerase
MKRETIFVTGASGLIGGRALRLLLNQRPALHADVLVRDVQRWERTASRCGIPLERVTVVRGDLRQPGLGLERAARRRLGSRAGAVVHLAADIVFSRSLDEARATNVEGTHRLLEATDGWHARFCHVSTAFVVGRRTGRIAEGDEAGGAGWVNAYEQSKSEAERIVRESGRDFVVLRPSTVVCDSTDGGVSQFNAVHAALRLFHHGLAPMVPGTECTPVDFVTAEYVSGAIAALALREDLGGETLHLCAGEGSASLGQLLDAAREVWSADAAWRRRHIARPVLTDLATYRLFEQAVEETAEPKLRRVVRSLSHFVPQLGLEKRFATRLADAALGFGAPPVVEYWPRLVRWLVGNRPAEAREAA